MTPSFWSTDMVSKIWAQVLVNGAYSTADHWDLLYQFPSTGTALSPVLWLSSISHVGRAGATLASPAVKFWGVRLQNRADFDPNASMASHQKWRIDQVLTEAGEQIDVTYAGDDIHCAPGDTPNPDNNPRRCFPKLYTNPSGSTGWSWWHKRIVTSVVSSDTVGGSPAIVTNYSYSTASTDTNVLWAHDGGAAVWGASLSRRSWSDWRGYTDVTVTTGPAAGIRSQTKYVYFRGLHGDRTDTGTRSVTLSPHSGNWTDQGQRAGHLMNEIIYDQVGGTPKQIVQHSPWAQVTGTRTESSAWAVPSTFKSHINRTSQVTRWEALDDGTLTYRTAVVDTFDLTNGRLLTRYDRGNSSTGDETCTRYSYADNPAKHMYAYVSQQVQYAVTCDDPYIYPDDAIYLEKWRYDGGDIGQAPTKGNVTRNYVYRDTTYVDVFLNAVYDKFGRLTSLDDDLLRTTTTAYTENADGLTTQVAMTNELGHTTTIALDVRRGQPISVADANGKVTTGTYDASGRLTSVTRPGNSTGIPDEQYAYNLSQTSPSWVRSWVLNPNGNQITSYEIYDGLLRQRQSHTPAPDGKRVISDLRYDGRGLAVKASTFYNADSGPSSTLVSFNDADIDRQTRYTYDGRGRPTAAEAWTRNTFKWKTAAIYGWNSTVTLPPAGGTTTRDIFDDRGNLIETRQYHTTDFNGAHDATRYSYDVFDRLTSVIDPSSNTWTYRYDMLGQKIEATDPDAGTSTYLYDNVGNLTKSTDARGQAVAYKYDALDRPTESRETSVSGPLLAAWTYDTLEHGLLTASTRYADGLAYTTAVTGYDDGYRPLGVSNTIPASAANGALADTYTTSATYKVDGSPATTTLPAAGNLTAETITYTYTAQGLPTTMAGQDDYIAAVTYRWDGSIAQTVHGTAGRQVRQTTTYDEPTGRLNTHTTDTENQTTPDLFDEASASAYTYDPAGNITATAGTTNGTADQAECFRYDHLRRLTEAWTEPTASCVTPQRAGADPYHRSWSFDKVGNRLTQTDHDPVAGNTTWTYNVGTAHGVKPHQLASVVATGPAAGSPTRSFSYNNAGQTTGRTTETGAAQILDWDTEGHLAALAEDGQTTSYLYDAAGNRLLARAPDRTTLYLGHTELELPAGGGPVSATRYYGVAARDSSGLTWTVADHHGTGSVQIQAATLTTQRRRSLPYGEPRGAQPPIWAGTKGFVGGTEDDTGLVHLGFREYDPSLGRFVSVDPIMDLGQPQQWHGYAYADNNPTTFSDPSGLLKEEMGMGSGGGNSGGCATSSRAECLANSALAYLPIVGTAIEGGLTVYYLSQGDFQKALESGAWLVVGTATQGLARIGGKLIKLRNGTRPPGKVPPGATIKNPYGKSNIDTAGDVADIKRWRRPKPAKVAPTPKPNPKPKPPNPNVGKSPTPAKSSCQHSFHPATPVLMADGTRRRIADVREGDKVIATDPVSGETAAKPVTDVHRNNDRDLADVTIRDTKSGGITVLHTTANHPFWKADTQRWTEAKDLQPGDRLLSPDGDTARMITAVKTWTGLKWMHDLTIADIHTYYVIAGNTPVLVHNCDTVDPNELRFSQNTAGGRGRAGSLRQSMSERGWDGDPVDVVRTQDGLTTIDNTRVAVAQELELLEIPVNIHTPDELLPKDMLGRFGSAATWGEALIHRASRQRPPLGPTGIATRPRMP